MNNQSEYLAFLRQQIKAQQEQTEAMNNLAASNLELVQVIIDGDAEGDDDTPIHYMDGTPIG
jgi:hypothetical protein